MRLTFTTKPQAQALCDRLHQWMIDTYPWYAESVAKGDTQAYANPYRDMDAEGNPVGTNWYVNIKDRCFDALTPTEKTLIKNG